MVLLSLADLMARVYIGPLEKPMQKDAVLSTPSKCRWWVLYLRTGAFRSLHFECRLVVVCCTLRRGQPSAFLLYKHLEIYTGLAYTHAGGEINAFRRPPLPRANTHREHRHRHLGREQYHRPLRQLPPAKEGFRRAAQRRGAVRSRHRCTLGELSRAQCRA